MRPKTPPSLKAKGRRAERIVLSSRIRARHGHGGVTLRIVFQAAYRSYFFAAGAPASWNRSKASNATSIFFLWARAEPFPTQVHF